MNTLSSHLRSTSKPEKGRNVLVKGTPARCHQAWLKTMSALNCMCFYKSYRCFHTAVKLPFKKRRMRHKWSHCMWAASKTSNEQFTRSCLEIFENQRISQRSLWLEVSCRNTKVVWEQSVRSQKVESCNCVASSWSFTGAVGSARKLTVVND